MGAVGYAAPPATAMPGRSVRSALSPSPTQPAEKALKREAVVHTYVDDSIIGGLVLRVGDKLIDASVRYQLQAMKEQMLAAAPK